MKSIVISAYGGADQLVYGDREAPQPGAGQVRLRVEAVGLNFVEIYHRKGLYNRPLPFVPGSECAGVVDAVGAGVAELRVGDRVATESAIDAYAELALAPAAKLFKLPANVTTNQGAALMLQGMTAHYLAFSTFPLRKGHVALVHAAAGGVGHLLVQIAKRTGARVIATVSTDEKAQFARQAGADDVIRYDLTDFETETKRVTEGRGVDVVYDSVGQATFEKSLNCLVPRGFLVLFGQSSGPVPPFDPQVLNRKGSLFLTRPTLAHYALTREEFEWRAHDLFAWLERGELLLRIDRTFRLAEAASAHRYMEERRTKGKVLLIP